MLINVADMLASIDHLSCWSDFVKWGQKVYRCNKIQNKVQRIVKKMIAIAPCGQKVDNIPKIAASPMVYSFLQHLLLWNKTSVDEN